MGAATKLRHSRGRRNGSRRTNAQSGTIVQVTSLIFLLVALPVVFCMLTWLVATVYRLYVPEASLALDRELSPVPHHEPSPADVPVSVGVREIKEDQRRWQRTTCSSPYYFLNGISNGVPSPWLDDVWQRRN